MMCYKGQGGGGRWGGGQTYKEGVMVRSKSFGDRLSGFIPIPLFTNWVN